MRNSSALRRHHGTKAGWWNGLGEIALALRRGRFIKGGMDDQATIGFPASDGDS
jgi:hypothetical protein